MNIYTDGSCLGNPGPGGYAAICTKNGNIIFKYSGNCIYTTNNRMELQAVISALEHADEFKKNITISTDSTYVKNGIEKWLDKWKTKKSWENKERKNQDLWEKLDVLNQKFKPIWKWIKAHSGNKFNERADALAKQKAKEVNNFELNTLQKKALSLILQGTSIFLTGGGGTGKSEFLKYFKKHYNTQRIAITSTTGTSAILIGGTTLHSYLGIGLGKGSMRSIAQKVRKKKYLRDRWINLKILVIDEISMLSAELFDKLEEVARIVRGNSKPFGGIQLVLSGDFCQLPCIGSDNFCFEAKSWNKCVSEVVYLADIIRQTDPKFQKVLSNLRLGIKDEETIDIINSRIGVELESKFGIIPTKLFSHNVDVDRINNNALQKLAEINGTDILEFERIIYLNTKRKIKHTQAPEKLSLTKGCQVMLLYNLDIANGLVNGSRGIVIDFMNDKPIVKFINGEERVIDYHIWEVEDNNVKLGTVEQIPLKLGYAFSIHKSQGATLDLVELDLQHIFTHGMGYVALSRVRSLDALSVKSINWSRFTTHPKALEFYEKL